ncbi:MAG TPA: type II toxin-antitoxin system RelE/ParE family toxin [Bdellovibrionota bacterium]|nr:type II toxin-antitoxin system RelE/ParE family toxin [Bdellovibrionota bacterium]
MRKRTWKVLWDRRVQKELDRLPGHIRDKFQGWVEAVERAGMEEVRKLKGYHDEPLHGQRRGQRSIRLSRGYRAIYEERADHTVMVARVIEVSKHGY